MKSLKILTYLCDNDLNSHGHIPIISSSFVHLFIYLHTSILILFLYDFLKNVRYFYYSYHSQQAHH